MADARPAAPPAKEPPRVAVGPATVPAAASTPATEGQQRALGGCDLGESVVARKVLSVRPHRGRGGAVVAALETNRACVRRRRVGSWSLQLPWSSPKL
jgi:hypothetical protein